MLKKLSLISSILLVSSLMSDATMEEDLGGFDNEEAVSEVSTDLDGFGEDLDGFASAEADIDDTLHVEKEKDDNIFRLSGDIAFKTSAGYLKHSVKAHKTDMKAIEYSGVNQAQIALYLQLDAKINDDWKLKISGDGFYDAIYDLHPNNNYNDDILDAYRTQLRFDDTYIQGRLSSDLDVKIGRQIVVWGKSDSIRITDVINPTDNRLPGMTDIEDLRLPTTMAKLDYYLGDWNFSAMAIAESRIFIEAAPRGEFLPVDKVFPDGAPDPFIELVQPSTSWDDMQYAFAANGVFSGWDLSFYGADVLDSKWHIDPISKKRVVSKIKMLGSAVNIAYGSWLLKSEVAYVDGVKYNSTDDAKNRLDLLAGFDYMGFKDTVVSLEVANKHIYDYESQMSQIIAKPDYTYKDEMQTAFRISKNYLNDSLTASALVTLFGQEFQYGGFARVWLEYEVADAVGLNLGVVDYLDGDKPFPKAIRDNDRVFADLTYSF